tara:strand:- start:3988 stop:4509 length:522 start_codon:yes stop_codon:yes gene_type:complete
MFKMTNNALQILFKSNQNELNSFIYSKVRNVDLMKDISQDTFVKLIIALRKNKYNEEGKFLSYAMRIAHNNITDHYRRKSSKPKHERSDTYDIFSKISNDELTQEEIIIKQDAVFYINNLVNNLPTNFKEAIILRFYKDLSFKDIATKTKVSINTALGRVRYGLERLRKSHGL